MIYELGGKTTHSEEVLAISKRYLFKKGKHSGNVSALNWDLFTTMRLQERLGRGRENAWEAYNKASAEKQGMVINKLSLKIRLLYCLRLYHVV